MSKDGIVWECINNGFCTFKVKTQVQTFCRNPYSVNGLCGRSACPLANSQYATITDEGGHIFLCMKTVERSHTPKTQWEKIELPGDYDKALKIVKEHLMYLPEFLKIKCRKRLRRIVETHARMRHLEKLILPKLVGVKQKARRRERSRQTKALAAAQLEKTIQRELLAQLAEGKYDGIYNFAPGAYEAALSKSGAQADSEKEASKRLAFDADMEELGQLYEVEEEAEVAPQTEIAK
eukprot:gnl/Dysnectes_brevis/1649_a1876_2924.p1 GENE.gnl/Dysnectes_brevis/1649_a1876_2924~~gnl/Dysnectes_brevis/1649_a1876_2924.p1  ORF type:complete len:236 (-),score=49.17 gnl/Dysnectes_brevis/1649_a1876_2924:49-756(-)